jgi:hypothetical protein
MTQRIVTADVVAAATGGVLELTGSPATQEGTQVLEDSPAAVITAYLINEGKMYADTSNTWPMYVSSLPDGINVVDNAGAAYDTLPVKDGRLMSGSLILHHGVQIKMRSVVYDDGWDKMQEIVSLLDTVVNELVTVGSNTYVISSISRNPVFPLGVEPGTKRRNLFTVNLLVTMRQI